MGESKAFDVLTEEEKKQLKNIFDDIDIDATKQITQDKSKSFNMFVEGVSEEDAEKDAADFINSCAIINKTSVSGGISCQVKGNFSSLIDLFGDLYE